MKMSMIYGALLEHHAEMVLDQALCKYKRKRLLEAIDRALQAGDRKRFLVLTSRLKLMDLREENQD